MADSYAVAAAAIEAIINAEFAPESITAVHDKLHESRGWEGTEVGISPNFWQPMPGNAITKDTFLTVQFYGYWEKEIDPTQSIDPRIVTGYADRFSRRVESTQATAGGSSNDVWYFEVTRIDFPDDPTGNKTRFEATVRARGDNTALTQR